MKIKTSELTGAALDWAVAHINGYKLTTDGISKLLEKGDKLLILGPHNSYLHYSPSTDWSQGGPIIEREVISVWWNKDGPHWCAGDKAWTECDIDSDEFAKLPDASSGPTPLIAAMRCYCASKLGEEVEVPDGLV